MFFQKGFTLTNDNCPTIPSVICILAVATILTSPFTIRPPQISGASFSAVQ